LKEYPLAIIGVGVFIVAFIWMRAAKNKNKNRGSLQEDSVEIKESSER